MAYDQNPKAYARAWYDEKIISFYGIAQALLTEPESAGWSDEQLARELHEWVSAPDSFFNWTSDEAESTEIFESILFISPNAYIAGMWESDDDSQMGYYAAHAFIADVMERLGRGAGPYLGPDSEE
jgi:hypothetical protein